MAGKRMLADREDKTRFESGFRVMNGEQEFVTYHQGTTLRVWYGDVPDHYSDHWHAAVEIALPISGSLRYTVQGREYLLREKDALLIPARTVHSLTTPPGSTRNLILFDPAPLQSLQEPPVIHTLLNEPLLLRNEEAVCGRFREVLFDMLRYYYAADPAANLYCYGSLVRAYALLAADAHPQEPSGAGESDVPESIRQALNRAFDYLDTRFSENITLANVAQAAGFSKYYFSRIFSQYTHLSFSQYLLKKRLSEASRLLCETNLRLLDVAVQSGFVSLSTFNRVFRANHGCTPSEYRALYRDGK